jgi:hypothetical protein
MVVGRPAHRTEVGDLPLVRSIELHRPDVGDEPLLVEPSPDDPRAVRREERSAVVARRVGQPRLSGPVGLHDVDLAEVARVERQLLLLGVAQRPFVGVAHRGERNPLAVGRVARLGVVAPRGREPLVGAGGLVVHVDVHLGVVVPRIAALLPRGPEVELGLLQRLRCRVVVRGREQDLRAARPEERARRLAVAGRDALGFPDVQVEHVDLIERVAWLTLALEDEAVAIRRPVAFAGATAFHGQPPDTREEVAFLKLCRGLGG